MFCGPKSQNTVRACTIRRLTLGPWCHIKIISQLCRITNLKLNIMNVLYLFYLKKGWGHHIRMTKKYHSFCEYRIKDAKSLKKRWKMHLESNLLCNVYLKWVTNCWSCIDCNVQYWNFHQKHIVNIRYNAEKNKKYCIIFVKWYNTNINIGWPIKGYAEEVLYRCFWSFF